MDWVRGGEWDRAGAFATLKEVVPLDRSFPSAFALKGPVEPPLWDRTVGLGFGVERYEVTNRAGSAACENYLRFALKFQRQLVKLQGMPSPEAWEAIGPSLLELLKQHGPLTQVHGLIEVGAARWSSPFAGHGVVPLAGGNDAIEVAMGVDPSEANGRGNDGDVESEKAAGGAKAPPEVWLWDFLREVCDIAYAWDRHRDLRLSRGTLAKLSQGGWGITLSDWVLGASKGALSDVRVVAQRIGGKFVAVPTPLALGARLWMQVLPSLVRRTPGVCPWCGHEPRRPTKSEGARPTDPPQAGRPPDYCPEHRTSKHYVDVHRGLAPAQQLLRNMNSDDD